ncbi:unnamed protein product [Meloidogyne enterolobii]|uniref:Uncharacterized protein n=1 Tax=Meloidogyne enterolobii TaxID=390850 RepID=A0ACB0YD61_MELEN
MNNYLKILLSIFYLIILFNKIKSSKDSSNEDLETSNSFDGPIQIVEKEERISPQLSHQEDNNLNEIENKGKKRTFKWKKINFLDEMKQNFSIKDNRLNKSKEHNSSKINKFSFILFIFPIYILFKI